MAVDKLVDSTQLNSDLTSIANAIRTKGGTSAQLAFPAGFVSAVEAIPTGGGGGSQFTKLTEINVTQDVRSVGISFLSAYEQYDFLVIVEDVTVDSGNDYIYFSTTDSSGGIYTNGLSSFKTLAVAINTGTEWVYYNTVTSSSLSQCKYNVPYGDTLYAYTYSAAKKIKSGSKFIVYGGKYADM